MSLSMYQASVPALLRGLTNLSAILDKAEANAKARNINPSIFVNGRLAPDMHDLIVQVHFVTIHAKGIGARLAGLDVPVYEDNETTIAELRARLAKTAAFLKSLTAAQIDGSEDRPVVMNLSSGQVSFTGQTYLLNFALPNFYFHFATAYAILRHNGVDVGKADYLGAF